MAFDGFLDADHRGVGNLVAYAACHRATFDRLIDAAEGEAVDDASLGAIVDAGVPLAVLQEAVDRRYFDEIVPVAGAEGLDAANVRAVHQALQQSQGPVLLHCASGNRAGRSPKLTMLDTPKVPLIDRHGAASTSIRTKM